MNCAIIAREVGAIQQLILMALSENEVVVEQACKVIGKQLSSKCRAQVALVLHLCHISELPKKTWRPVYQKRIWLGDQKDTEASDILLSLHKHPSLRTSHCCTDVSFGAMPGVWREDSINTCPSTSIPDSMELQSSTWVAPVQLTHIPERG